MRSLNSKGEAQRNYASCLSPTDNGSLEIQHFECCDAIEIRDGIIFNFYTRLPHLVGQLITHVYSPYQW